jgi:site-specific recombinase XerD
MEDKSMTSKIIPTSQDKLILLDRQPLDKNPAMVYLASLAETGRRSQRQALEVIANLLIDKPDILAVNWSKLRFQHTSAIRAKLIEVYSPATTRRMLCALRKTLRAAWRLGQMTHEQMSRACELESVTGENLLAGRALSSGEIAALMQACESDLSAAGARDAALIACMYPAGLRRDEIISLDLDDYDKSNLSLKVRHGKRNKARLTYINNGASQALDDWISIRGDRAGALLLPVNKAGQIIYRRLSDQAAYNALQKRGEQAGIDHLSPHDLRRTFISDLLDAGADITTVAKLAGHESVNTTARYDRRPETAKSKAAGLLHLPYHSRKSGE